MAMICVLALIVSLAGGCIPRTALEKDEMSGYWYLQADAWGQAKRQSLRLADTPLPARWVFRHDPSLIWSTVSMVRAVDRMKSGDVMDVFDVGVSNAHADLLAQVLADTRTTLTGLRDVADPKTPKTPDRWAGAVAEALVSVEQIARLTSPDRERGDADADPMALSAGPMLQMVAAYLNERTGGSLLAGMPTGGAGGLRGVLVQIVLRVGFAAAGKQDPPGLRDAVIAAMRRGQKPAALTRDLAAMLRKPFDTAAPAAPGSRLGDLLSTAFAIAPPLLEVLESFVGQWDRLDRIAMEFRQVAGRPIVSVTIRVKPGRELRLAKMHFLQPALVFRGGTRITVQPHAKATRETVVLFEPLAGGRAEVRFEGLLYGLVRLLALPLDNAALREVRVSSTAGPSGRLTSATILMEAVGRKTDRRRIMTFQDARTTRLVRTAFGVRSVTERSEQVFNYITPDRRYTYRRKKTADR